MKSAFLVSFQISAKPRDPQQALDQILRILDLVNRYGIHATWEIPDDPQPMEGPILAIQGQEIRPMSDTKVPTDVLDLRPSNSWSVVDFIRGGRYLSQLDRTAKYRNIWRLRVDLRDLNQPISLDELKKIFGRYAWHRDHDEMESLNSGEWERRWNQAVAGNSLTISPTNPLASPNNISVRSM